MPGVANENRTIDELVRANLVAADRTPGHARRGQHPKHHGCVRAALSIGDWIPEDLRIGIFSAPETFPAFVRFSNGRVWDDREADVHGMAIKLLDVPGPKLIPGHQHETAADFVLVDSEVFFTGDLEEYLRFTEGFLTAQRNGLYAAYFWTRFFLLQLGLLRRVRRFADRRPISPLLLRYFSAVPYKLGSRAVKYVVRPRDPRSRMASLGGPNGLARVLSDTLAVSGVTFDFGVDIQVDEVGQPIEDPTVAWSENSAAKREWLGVLRIPRQDVAANAELAEDLAFSP